MTDHSRKPVKAIHLQMGYWPAAQREQLFRKEPDRTERIFTCQGYLISEVTFFLEEQGWVMGYMLGYNDGKSGLSVTPEEAIRHHRSRALVEVTGGCEYGLLTVGLLAQYRLWAEGWLQGHRDAMDAVYGPEVAERATYAEVRDALRGLTDMPDHWPPMLALWLTRDHATMFWLSAPQVL
jgi:hypothetical protein